MNLTTFQMACKGTKLLRTTDATGSEINKRKEKEGGGLHSWPGIAKAPRERIKNGAVKIASEPGTIFTALSQVVLAFTLRHNAFCHNGTEVCIPLD
jgi:hypothetical protein